MMTWGEAAGRLRRDLDAARATLEEGVWIGPDGPLPLELPSDPPDAATHAELLELLAEAHRIEAELDRRRAEIRAELERMGRVRGAGRAYLAQQAVLGRMA